MDKNVINLRKSHQHHAYVILNSEQVIWICEVQGFLGLHKSLWIHFDSDVYFLSLPLEKDIVEARHRTFDLIKGMKELPYKERLKSYDFG